MPFSSTSVLLKKSEKFDFAAGEAEYKKALELDPNDATAHQRYAEDLGSLGRTQEALAETARSQQLDPLVNHRPLSVAVAIYSWLLS